MIDPTNPTQKELIALLQQGSEAWNAWRSEHSDLALDFKHVDFTAEDTLVTDFSHIRFGDKVNFRYATFGNDINFIGASFGNDIGFFKASFGNEIKFTGASFGNDIGFTGASFGNNIYFIKTSFGNEINFFKASFGNVIYFSEASFGNIIYFSEASFGNDIYFSEASFGNVIDFIGASFGNDIDFTDARFGNMTEFVIDKIGDDIRLHGITYGDRVILDRISIDLPIMLEDIDLSNISIRDVDFKHINMEGAIFDGANMLGAQNLTLDSTSIRNTRFDDNAKDHWSVLRRVYTGPNMIVTLLFLVAFSLPYVSKVGFWVTVNKSQHHVENTTAEMRQSVEDTARRFKIPQSQIDELLPSPQQIKNRSLCLNDECRDIRLWKLLVGLDKGVGVMLFVIGLILFNALKGLITVMVIPMREQEERTGYSPSYKTSLKVSGSDSFKESFKEAIGSKTPLSNLWKLWTNVNIRWGYAPFYQMHRIVKILFWFSTVAFLWNAFHWLSRTIWIPA